MMMVTGQIIEGRSDIEEWGSIVLPQQPLELLLCKDRPIRRHRLFLLVDLPTPFDLQFQPITVGFQPLRLAWAWAN